MRALAQHLQDQGRGKDTVLVHMSPREIGGLQALARSAGGSLTTNPKTGLPEAGFLEDLLPTLAGVAGGALGVDPWIAGLGGAAVQTAITGDLSKGLMAGLGAYGGASIGYGLLGGADRDVLGLNSNFSKGDVNLSSGEVGGQQAPTAGMDTNPQTNGGVYTAAGQAPTAVSEPPNIVHNTAGIDPSKGSWGNFTAAAAAGTPFQNTVGSFAKYAPYAAALGVAAPLLNSTGPQTTPYNPSTSSADPVYKGPYTPVPRKVIRNPQAAYDSAEHMYFDNVNPYGVVSHATGGLVALADGGGVESSPAPDLYDAPERGKVYSSTPQRTGRDYLDLINHGGGGPTSPVPPRDFTFHPETGGTGEKNYGIVAPAGVDLGGTGSSGSGDFSGGYGAPPGGQIYGPTNDGTFAGIDGNPGSTGDRYRDISGDINFGTLGIGGSNFGNTGYGDSSTGTSGLGAAAGRVGDYASNFLKAPSSWTGDNTRQALINAAGLVPGAGLIPSGIAAILDGLHITDKAGSTGSGAGDLAGQPGMVQRLLTQGVDSLYHGLGGDYSAAEEVAPFNDAFNQSAAGVNDIYNTTTNSPSAMLSNYYGPEDAALGVESRQNSDMINGRGMFAPGSSYWESVAQQFSNLGDSGGSGRSAGDSGVGGIGGSGAWNGSGGGGGWGGFGDSATRLGGDYNADAAGRLPNGPQGSARGGPVQLGNGSFVMDARTVSELGNGSSSAGQELLARLGGQPIHGPGDGVSDSVHANIGGTQDARVARDEVQFSPHAVARLGGGDPQKGSKYLYSLMAKARQARMEAAKKDGGRGVDTGLRALVGAR